VDYFTFMAVDEEDMPWSGQKVWKVRALPTINMQNASATWLNALGV